PAVYHRPVTLTHLSVIAVEEGNPHNTARDLFMGIDIVEYEPPSAAVAVQNQLRIPGCEQRSDFINHFFYDLRVARGIGAPGRPAPLFILKIGHHHGPVSYHPPEEPRLCAYVLDVIVDRKSTRLNSSH